MSTPSDIRQVDRDLARLTEGLIHEYQVQLPAGSVIRTVARIVARLRDQRVPVLELAAQVEPIARTELAARVSGT